MCVLRCACEPMCMVCPCVYLGCVSVCVCSPGSHLCMGLSACACMHVICAPPEGERGAPLTTACCIMHQQGTLPQTPAHTPHTPGREGGREGEREMGVMGSDEVWLNYTFRVEEGFVWAR